MPACASAISSSVMIWLGRLARRTGGRVVLVASCKGGSSGADGAVLVVWSVGALVEAPSVASWAVVGSAPALATSSSEDSSMKGPLKIALYLEVDLTRNS